MAAPFLVSVTASAQPNARGKTPGEGAPVAWPSAHLSSATFTEPTARLRRLANTGPVFLALETLGSITVFAAYSIAAGDVPESCRWCEAPGFDKSLRDTLVWGRRGRKAAATTSHVLAIGTGPVTFAALLGPALSEGKGRHALEDAWIMLNSFLLTTGVADGTKKVAGRTRPAFHYGESQYTEGNTHRLETNLSFFSGDTAWAFSLASSASTLAFLRRNQFAPYVAAGGGALALGAGYLRIAADVHWTTDVLVGAAVGTGIGVAVPLLLHRPEGGEPVALRMRPWIGRTNGFDLAFAW